MGFYIYSDLPNNRAANFIPMIGTKFAARLFGRSEYSNTLESHTINLRGQDNLKTQKVVQKSAKSRSRSIYVTYILNS